MFCMMYDPSGRKVEQVVSRTLPVHSLGAIYQSVAISYALLTMNFALFLLLDRVQH